MTRHRTKAVPIAHTFAVTVHLEPALGRRLKAVADAADVSASDFALSALVEAIVAAEYHDATNESLITQLRPQPSPEEGVRNDDR